MPIRRLWLASRSLAEGFSNRFEGGAANERREVTNESIDQPLHLTLEAGPAEVIAASRDPYVYEFLRASGVSAIGKMAAGGGAV